jgi:alpha-glucosidase (family GH31 glycosyl hydrolase)
MIYTQMFPVQFKPVARPEAVIMGPGVRFTLLASRLLRMEYSPTEDFEDRPSQVFWYREQPVPDFQLRQSTSAIEIETSHLRLNYTGGDAGFTADELQITLKDGGQVWHYGQADPQNLGGTARTLDRAHGVIGLEPGLLSRDGWAIVDDTPHLVFTRAGWLTNRDAPSGYRDLYFFGYGRDYTACLADYCSVAGAVPLLPRWALGNWWSRYWPYSADELLGLMQAFQMHQVPLAVCIVDMDWHITDTGNRSSGWTGYTWNRDLFPDPPAFIRALHEMGLKTALNLHPALGVWPHEAQYREMAERLGIDPATEQPVAFDIADPDFTRAYFEVLHHPHEQEGVDFWWMDWQQGTESRLSGLDPLWWLNHLHFYDLGRDETKRPFIFSRWGGLGNHRYPIGFSGDTVVSWESLAFQPFFTATAANVGYGWWSHDIGGHMGGIEDAELYARWVQFGVFSPILRLHSTKNLFHERRPWGYDAETLRVTRAALQLRHALIPYLYSMSWRNHISSVPMVRPMYHTYPAHEAAYHCPDQYTFGSELLAAPFIRPANPETRMSRQVVWLPPGQWFDFHSALPYTGDRWHAIYGGLEDVPVFAKAGAIVPMTPKTSWDDVGTPAALEIQIFPGAANRFELYEDDGASTYSLIPFDLSWTERRLQFVVEPAQGATDHLPARRDYAFHFRGIANAGVSVAKNGRQTPCQVDYDNEGAVLIVSGVSLAPADRLAVTLTPQGESLLTQRDHRAVALDNLLRACRLNTDTKQMLHLRLKDILRSPHLLGDFELALSAPVAQAMAEILTGAGVDANTDPATGGQRILLWNSDGSQNLRFQFAGVPLAGVTAARRSGPLPRFAVLTIQGSQLTFLLEHGPQHVESVGAWLDALAADFQPEAIGDLDIGVQFLFRGEQGYQAHVHLSQQGLVVTPGVAERADVSLETGDSDWLALINGEIDPTELFLSGRLQVSGEMDLLMRLADLLSATPGQRHFRADAWKLEVNYLDMLTKRFGP